jgi:hypothetical protein
MAAGGINLRDTANTPYTGHGVTASLVGGSLPPGLTASVVNDQLQFSGTPTVQGTFQPQYKLTDADGWNITPNRIFFTVQP